MTKASLIFWVELSVPSDLRLDSVPYFYLWLSSVDPVLPKFFAHVLPTSIKRFLAYLPVDVAFYQIT